MSIVIRSALAVFVVTSMAACGKSICAKTKDASASLTTKASACPLLKDAVASNSSDEATCNNNVSGCTDADQKAYDDFLTCVNGVAACVAGMEAKFGTDLQACLTKVSGLSSACVKAISKGTTGASGAT